MKFLFEFVSCCGAPPLPAAAEEGVPIPEESRQLEHRRRYRKERTASSRSSSSVEWQPSLSSISEDNIILEKEERPAESEKTPKRKVASSAKIHVRSRSYSGDYGRSQIAMIPTFSPAPFMF